MTIFQKTWNGINSRIKRGRPPYNKIKNLISVKQLESLWIRDKGWLLKKPSIDRKRNKGHYTFRNCQWIELRKNCEKAIQDPELHRRNSKRRWKDPKFRRKMIRKIRLYTSTKRFKKLRSEEMKKRWKDPEYRKKMCKMTSKLWQNPKYKKNQSEKIKLNHKRGRYHLETRKRGYHGRFTK